jgi:hypothetical protein
MEPSGIARIARKESIAKKLLNSYFVPAGCTGQLYGSMSVGLATPSEMRASLSISQIVRKSPPFRGGAQAHTLYWLRIPHLM